MRRLLNGSVIAYSSTRLEFAKPSNSIGSTRIPRWASEKRFSPSAGLTGN